MRVESEQPMKSEYIETRGGCYFITGTRVSLDSVVYPFNRGDSPERVLEQYPILKLSQVYAAIAFYLDHKAEIDAYLEKSEREFEADTIPLAQSNPALWDKLENARVKMGFDRP